MVEIQLSRQVRECYEAPDRSAVRDDQDAAQDHSPLSMQLRQSRLERVRSPKLRLANINHRLCAKNGRKMVSRLERVRSIIK